MDAGRQIFSQMMSRFFQPAISISAYAAATLFRRIIFFFVSERLRR